MKIQGFVLLAIFLNIFRTGYSLALPQNKIQSPWQRVFGGYLIPRDSDYKQGFTVLLAYFENMNDPYPSEVCSGSIITKEYIVSTADCLSNQGLTVDGFFVYITGLLGTRFERTITETELHKHYDETNLENNIGLGKVNEPYDFSTGELFPVRLPKKTWGPDKFEGEPLTVCGYRDPYTTENYFDFEPTCFIFTPRDRDYCTVDQGLTLQDDEICASSSKMEKYSVCQRDYGAGLIYVNDEGSKFKFYLYAIASYNVPYESCAEGPTVYFVVSSAVDWIKAVVG